MRTVGEGQRNIPNGVRTSPALKPRCSGLVRKRCARRLGIAPAREVEDLISLGDKVNDASYRQLMAGVLCSYPVHGSRWQVRCSRCSRERTFQSGDELALPRTKLGKARPC